MLTAQTKDAMDRANYYYDQHLKRPDLNLEDSIHHYLKVAGLNVELDLFRHSAEQRLAKGRPWLDLSKT